MLNPRAPGYDDFAHQMFVAQEMESEGRRSVMEDIRNQAHPALVATTTIPRGLLVDRYPSKLDHKNGPFALQELILKACRNSMSTFMEDDVHDLYLVLVSHQECQEVIFLAARFPHMFTESTLLTGRLVRKASPAAMNNGPM